MIPQEIPQNGHLGWPISRENHPFHISKSITPLWPTTCHPILRFLGKLLDDCFASLLQPGSSIVWVGWGRALLAWAAPRQRERRCASGWGATKSASRPILLCRLGARPSTEALPPPSFCRGRASCRSDLLICVPGRSGRNGSRQRGAGCGRRAGRHLLTLAAAPGGRELTSGRRRA